MYVQAEEDYLVFFPDIPVGNRYRCPLYQLFPELKSAFFLALLKHFLRNLFSLFAF
jgi:hypothetical protein